MKLKKDYSSKYMGYADRPRTAPADTLENQPDQAKSETKSITIKGGGRRSEPQTWMDKIKRKFKIKKRKKKNY